MRNPSRILKSILGLLGRLFFFEILEINSSVFGICAFRFTVICLGFLEPSAIFTDLSFFTVMTAGLTKQFSSILLYYQYDLVLLVSLFFPPIVVSESVWVFLSAVKFLRLLSVVFLLPVRLLCGFR